MKLPYDILISPYITEKGTNIKESTGKVMFKVAMNSNKIEVKRACESLFNVKVTDVNIIKNKGKKKRVRFKEGKRPDWKKAVITLAEGSKIEFFEGI